MCSIVMLQIGTGVEEFRRKRVDECLTRHCTWQPQVLVIGSDIFHVEQVFVLFGANVLFEMPSVLKAIDTCYKVFFVFNSEYPCECLDSWMFLQRCIYDMNTPFDKVSPRITELARTITNVLD